MRSGDAGAALADDDARSSRFGAQGGPSMARYEALLRQREQKRKLLEKIGGRKGPLVGTCPDMCPEFERLEREVHLDLSSYEMVPGTEAPRHPGDHPRIDHGRAVKKYHRPAAGNEAPLPEDVRPPSVMRRTMDYLVGLMEAEVSRAHGDPVAALAQVQKFVRDRTRSLRQDATLQGLHLDVESIRIHQEIARFHIFSGHRLCELPKADFDGFQNTEQLRKVLQSLAEFYADIRRARGPAAGLQDEAEFRAYYLLTHLEDPDVYRKSFGWDAVVRASPLVQLAMIAGAAFHQSDYVAFFGLLTGRAPQLLASGAVPRAQLYLALCLLQTHFVAMRRRAAAVIAKAYAAPGDAIPAVRFAAWLALEDPAELETLCAAVGFGLVRGPDGTILAVLPTKDKQVSTGTSIRPRRSDRLIEALVSGLTLSQLIKGSAVPTMIPQIQPVSQPMTLPAMVSQVPVIPQVPVVSQVPALKPIPPVPQNLPSSVVPPGQKSFVPPVIPPAAPTNPVPPIIAPIAKLPSSPSIDYGRLSELLWESLIMTLTDQLVAEAVQAALSRQAMLEAAMRYAKEVLLEALADDLVLQVALGVAQSANKAFRGQRDVAQQTLLDNLTEAVVSTVVSEAASEAIKAEYVERFKRQSQHLDDPLETAYESAICIPTSGLAKRHRRMLYSLKQLQPETERTRFEEPQVVTQLTAGLEAEREASGAFEAYLQSLLS